MMYYVMLSKRLLNNPQTNSERNRMLYIAEVVAIIEEAKKRGEHSYTFINLSSYVRHILMKVGYKIRFSIDENWNGVYKVEW